MKIFAINLPQFHTFPENDKWWGKGFTEWTNVKRAKALYEGHMQPLVPLNGDYYDLTDPKAVVAQHKLAGRYGVDGFVYYHCTNRLKCSLTYLKQIGSSACAGRTSLGLAPGTARAKKSSCPRLSEGSLIGVPTSITLSPSSAIPVI